MLYKVFYDETFIIPRTYNINAQKNLKAHFSSRAKSRSVLKRAEAAAAGDGEFEDEDLREFVEDNVAV